MTTVAVMYPADAGTFDHGYYMATHMPLVRERWTPMGLTTATVLRGVPGPDGSAPTYAVVTLLRFSSMDAFKAAGAAHGREIMGDIRNFFPGKPIMQFSEEG